ncbi:MAG: hypothetical protein HQL01_02200 [Nitrospirae bacterium]|nr:hypothetical protein [Nitrospirota bacterium]
MKKKLLVYLSLLLTLALCSIVYAEGKKADSAPKQGSILYVCNCGPTCTCNTVLTAPGKCSCGQDTVPMHVLKIEGSEAILCSCGASCTCELDKKDATKCTCGKAVKRVSIKGLYACSCGNSCTCNTVTDKPGKCPCGSDLKKV